MDRLRCGGRSSDFCAGGEGVLDTSASCRFWWGKRKRLAPLVPAAAIVTVTVALLGW
jgi:hypothetical protein